MPEELLAIGGFFFTVIVLALGIPLVRVWARQKDRETALAPVDPAQAERLARIEHAVEAIAIEVERISEGQRFVTRLLAERAPEARALPSDLRPGT